MQAAVAPGSAGRTCLLQSYVMFLCFIVLQNGYRCMEFLQVSLVDSPSSDMPDVDPMNISYGSYHDSRGSDLSQRSSARHEA